MKIKQYLIGILTIILLFGSCDSFFDVNPQTEIVGDVLFQEEAGFREALTGVYIKLKSNNAYGRALTMTTIEHLVSSWDVTTNSVGYRLGRFEYENADVQSAFDGIYRQAYNTVANINELLSHIDAKEDVFSSPDMFNMIKGESLALRAYVHFDILRLFGPVPTSPGVGNSLPYVKAVSTEQNPLLGFEQFKIELLNDLKQAEELLQNSDPFTEYSINDFQQGNYITDNDFSSYRYLRMNYYAVKALQARAHLWFNETTEAYAAAKTVIDATDSNNTPKFRLGRATDFADEDFVLTCEHIFGLYDFDLYSKFQIMYAQANYKKGQNETLINEELFGNTGTDIRESSLWETIQDPSLQNSYILKKYKVAENVTAVSNDYKQIPMLRISEMYFIAIETAPQDEAEQLWEEFTNSRNYEAEDLPADDNLKKALLLKEYRKEFYAEGQAYFAYKRTDAPLSDILFAPASAELSYLPPMPKIETTIVKK